ncbi:MAG: hypothetical protein ACE5E6_00990 [Phycisphaerae bacterium]
MWSEHSEGPDGGCAFPFVDRLDERTSRIEKGMTLRDYFAAQALVGMLSGAGAVDYQVTAQMAYEIADAMVERRGARSTSSP